LPVDRAEPLLPVRIGERRAQAGEGLRRGAGPDGLVDVEGDDRTVRAGDLERGHLPVEPPVGPRVGRASVARVGELVQLLAREVPLTGDQLGADPLGDEAAGVAGRYGRAGEV